MNSGETQALCVSPKVRFDDSSSNVQWVTSLAQALFSHLAKFGLKMHVGTAAEKSKSVAMYFPATLKKTQEQNKIKSLLPDIKLNNNTNLIHFVQDFKYLGSIISNDLKEDTEIKARIKKAWSVIGAMKFVLKNKDVNLNTKIFLYTTAPLQVLLWGAESWSLSKQNLNALIVFHHSAIRWILEIKMNQVKEEKNSINRGITSTPNLLFYAANTKVIIDFSDFKNVFTSVWILRSNSEEVLPIKLV